MATTGRFVRAFDFRFSEKRNSRLTLEAPASRLRYGPTTHHLLGEFCLTRSRPSRLPERGEPRSPSLPSHDDLIALVQAQHAQIEAQAQQISVLTARIAELEARLAAPAKPPDNSSIPPSKGQKSNLPDRPKKPRCGRPGVARALTEHPDRIIEATLAACPYCAYAFGPPTCWRSMPATTST